MQRERPRLFCWTYLLAGGPAALVMSAALAALVPWVSLGLFALGTGLILTWATHWITKDSAAVGIVVLGFACRCLLAAALWLIPIVAPSAVASLRTDGYWNFALDASVYEADIRRALAGTLGTGTWVNDVTGESVRNGERIPAPPGWQSPLGRRPPDDRPGWRLSAEGDWINDLTGEWAHDGIIEAQAEPPPSRTPPDDRPGWRLSAEGDWINDLTGEWVHDGILQPLQPAAEPTPEARQGSRVESARPLRLLSAERAGWPPSEPSPPDEQDGWRWVSDVQWNAASVWVALPFALLIRVFGDTPLTPLCANALFGAVAALLSYWIVRGWSGRLQARLSCAWFALWPSWVLWSAVLLKESMTLLLCVLAVAAGIALETRFLRLTGRPWSRTAMVVLALGVALVGLQRVRPVMAVSWVVAALIAIVLATIAAVRLRRDREALVRGTLVVALGLLVLPMGQPLLSAALGGGLPGAGKVGPLDAVVLLTAERRMGSATSGGVLVVGADRPVESGDQLLALFPLALANTFLIPYPTSWFAAGQSVGGFRLLAAVEGGAFYLLLVPLLLGAVVSLRRGSPGGMQVLLFVIIAALSTGLVVMNEGTLFRVRAVPVALLVLLGTAGWDLAWLRRRFKQQLAPTRVVYDS